MPIYFAFFSLIAVAEDGQCAIFEILFPCCCKKKLIHTKQKIIVDLACFCYVTIFQPIDDNYVCHTTIREKICTTISGSSDRSPRFIWLNNMPDVENVVTVNVCTTQPFTMKIYEQEGIFSTIAVDEICKAFTLHNILLLEIQSQANSTVELMVTWKKIKNIELA